LALTSSGIFRRSAVLVGGGRSSGVNATVKAAPREGRFEIHQRVPAKEGGVVAHHFRATTVSLEGRASVPPTEFEAVSSTVFVRNFSCAVCGDVFSPRQAPMK
jgi:hypothetical protein